MQDKIVYVNVISLRTTWKHIAKSWFSLKYLPSIYHHYELKAKTTKIILIFLLTLCTLLMYNGKQFTVNVNDEQKI